jgi:drug/metabolite transporter (DMT)-like permease
VRVLFGAAVLLAIARGRGHGAGTPRGAWARGAALFAYAALFSWAYVRVEAGVGALVLFAAVQATMLGAAARAGRGPRGVAWVGVALALGGLAALTLPGAASPDPLGVALMAGAGAAWGAYSLLGRGSDDPLADTAAAFARAAPLALVAFALAAAVLGARADGAGIALAAASGAVASGLGYATWYAALRGLDAVRAAVVQLLVPVLAAAGGVAFLGERAGVRLLAAGAAVLAGVALTVRRGEGPARAPSPR